MRATSITVHNNQTLEVFVEKREEGFEYWGVGPIKGRRMLLHHHLTHDDFEAHLEYAQEGDLVWRDALPSEIPNDKHRAAIEDEETIKRSVFWDSSPTIVLHLFGDIVWLDTDRKETNAAKKALLGRWTDGVITIDFESDHKLTWQCTNPSDRLHIGVTNWGKNTPDWWNFGGWRLLIQDEHGSGESLSVLRVDGQELHLPSDQGHRLARVFHRVKEVEEHIGESDGPGAQPDNPSKRERVSRPAGEVTPLLCELEQAVIYRNPLLAERLNPGLPECKIRAALEDAGISGETDRLIQLYSWSNGVTFGKNESIENLSLFPQDAYYFMDLKEAIGSWQDLNAAVDTLVEMTIGTKASSIFSDIKGRLFPFFADGAGGILAVDLSTSKLSRVLLVDFELYGKPTQAYRSFESFMKDVIRANIEDDSLRCFSRSGKQ